MVFRIGNVVPLGHVYSILILLLPARSFLCWLTTIISIQSKRGVFCYFQHIETQEWAFRLCTPQGSSHCNAHFKVDTPKMPMVTELPLA
jgi:fatty acid desaturase